MSLKTTDVTVSVPMNVNSVVITLSQQAAIELAGALESVRMAGNLPRSGETLLTSLESRIKQAYQSL